MISRSEAVFAALNAGVVIHAADSAILDANDRARRLLGIQDLEGRFASDPSWVFMEADGSPMSIERYPVMQVINSGGALHGMIVAVRPPQGPDICLEVNALPVWADSGDLAEVAVTFIDVTAEVGAERTLAAVEEVQRTVLDNAGQGIVRVGRDLRIDYSNKWVASVLGVSQEALIGRPVKELDYPRPGCVKWKRQAGRVIKSGRSRTFEYEVRDGSTREWHEASLHPQFGSDGTVTHVVLTDRDISERKQAEAAAHARQAQIRQAERAAHVGTWTLDLATMLFTWSEEMLLMHGLDPAGPPPDFSELDQLFTAESWQRLSTAMTATQESGAPFEMELEAIRPDGSHVWLLAQGDVLRDAAGEVVGLQGVCADVTEAKRAAAELHRLATHDPLTGLANRTEMFDELTRALQADRASGRVTAVLMLDLDHFKNVNDTLGHGLGDALLAAAAARIVTVVSVGDLVARPGGDEFLVVMRGLADPLEAVNEAQRLVVAFRRSFLLGGTEVYSSVSIGIAVADGCDVAGDLVRDADTALFAAKRQGRNRAEAFNEELRAAVTSRVSIETELRRSVERDQLAVWFQPEVELATGRVTAVEALLRWHHPDGTVWTADRFIDVAEDTGLILNIGEWVFRQACRHVVAWEASREGPTPTVRINFSTLQLAEAGLLEAIDGILAETSVDPGRLCIEITETTLLCETTTARLNLHGIHDRGIGIAIDDFGTGYASLTYLNTFPVDVIKIDRSFVAGDADPDHRLVAGIIALAKTMQIAVTAEGVEHPEQASRLREMGCPSAQGWLYAKALPADEVTPLLDHYFPH